MQTADVMAASCFTSCHSNIPTHSLARARKLRELATSANAASKVAPLKTHRRARKHGRQMPFEVLDCPVEGDPMDDLVLMCLIRRLDGNTYRLLFGIPHIHFDWMLVLLLLSKQYGYPVRFLRIFLSQSQKSTQWHNVVVLWQRARVMCLLCLPWQRAILFPNTRWLPLIGCRPLVQRRGSSPSCTLFAHARKCVVGSKRDGRRQPKVQRTVDSGMMQQQCHLTFQMQTKNINLYCIIEFSQGYSYLNDVPQEEPLSLSVMLYQLRRFFKYW